MIEFSPLYTGKDSAVKMPELTQLNRAQERAQELNIKGEELKYKTALLDKETFMKQLSIDPVATVSNANMVKQAQKYDEFKNKWADRLAKSGGRLSDADKIQMEVDHNQLRGWQNQILANQAGYLAALETKKKDTQNYYDPNVFRIAQEKYLSTGELDPNILSVAPQSMTAYLNGLKPTQETVTPIKTEVKDDKGNIVGYRIVDQKTKATKEQAQYNILEGARRNEGLMKGIITDFDAWFNDPKTPQKDKDDLLKDYDTNGNGKIDPAESQYIHTNTSMPDNPIMKWAMNYPPYLERGMGVTESSSKTIAVPRSGASDISINIGGADLKVSPATKRDSPVVYGDKTYNDTYAFAGNTTLSNLPTDGGLRFRGTSSRGLKKGNITGKLKDYVADDDMIIIEASTGIPELDIETKGLVAIPRSSIQGADNLPVIVNGKTTTIGAIRGTNSATATAQAKSTSQRGILDNL